MIDGSLPLSNKQMWSIANATAPMNIWTGAVRSGKTVGSLVRFLMDVANAPDNANIVIVGNTKDSAYENVILALQNREVFGEFADHIFCNPKSDTANILGHRVNLIGSYDIKAENRIRGRTIYLAYVDEITLCQEDFFAMLTTRLSAPGAKLLGTTNPGSPAHWFRQSYLLKGQDIGLKNFHFTLDDNPYLEPEFVARTKAQHSGLFYKRFILGEWVAGSGAIYSMWDPSIHVVDELPNITNWIGVGIDYGDINPTAALLTGIGPDGCIYFASEYRNAGKESERPRTVAEHSMHIRNWLSNRGVHPAYWCVDPAAAAFRNQLYADGVSAIKANNDVVPGIQVMSSLMAAGKLKVHKSCEGFINEVASYSWDDKAALIGKEQPVKVNDHSLDAGRYVIATTKNVWRPFTGNLA